MTGPDDRPIMAMVPPPIAVSRADLEDARPGLIAVITAELAGERPHCECTPIRAYPDGPVICYSHQCAAHLAGAP